MKRLVALVAAIVMIPASVAVAADLEDLLERSRGASFSGQQIISCMTPDGIRDAMVRFAQDGRDIWIASSASGDVEVTAGSGGWTLLRGGHAVISASVETSDESVGASYTVVDERVAQFLGRSARTYNLIRDGVLRAQLMFDDEVGALVEATTFLEDGSAYCQRRFISFDSTSAELTSIDPPEGDALAEPAIALATLPETIQGFERLDSYLDEDGSTFAYYSDGFFSFAVFETPTIVTLPGGIDVEFDGSVYQRSFTAGQSTYVWEVRDGGMALVGDLPPDLHQSVLAALPESETPGLLDRVWRSLFG